MAKVLFCHYEVLSILLAPSHLMPLFGLGVKDGLVLDIGYAEATLIPVYENVPILKVVTPEIKTTCFNANTVPDLNKVLEDSTFPSQKTGYFVTY